MPKIKTHKAAAKRYRVTGTGKVRFSHVGRRHILTKKSTKRKRGMRQGAYATPANNAVAKRLVLYK